MPSPTDAAWLQALFEGVDAARAEAEREWGADRLAVLVPDDLRTRLRTAQARWRTAYEASWDAPVLTADLKAEVQKRADVMRRAWPALVAAAVEAGHRPLVPDVWEVVLADGTVAAFVRTADEARHVVASGRALAVFTMDEVANLIDAMGSALKDAKVYFPGATVIQSRQVARPDWVRHGDPIPF